MVDPYLAAGAKPVSPRKEIRGSGYDVQQQAGLAELTGKYLQNKKTLLDIERTRATPLPQKEPTPEEKADAKRREARATIIGQGSAKAELNLPQLENSAKMAIDQVSGLLKHPGFQATVGAPNPFKGGLGFGTVPWSPARDFQNELTKAMGGVFMQAREGLKGAGQVTDFEGKKAEQALAAMNTATSEQAFKKAAQDYANAIANGVKIARKVARMGAIPYSYEELMAEKARRSGGK